jgi:hypothetical protein
LAFLRFSRDKRGYENFYLVETSTNRRGKTRVRVLYWFRTPPGVKVGREPFDPDIRRALEAQNPDVVFDWRKISETPIPSADAERWRERRRLERADRARRRGAAGDSGEAAGADTQTDEVESPDELSDDVSTAEDVANDVAPDDPTESSDIVDPPAGPPSTIALESPALASAPAPHPSAMGVPDESLRRRRRRRRGRHRRAATPGGPRAIPSVATREPTESKESSAGTAGGESGDPDDASEV